MTSFTPFFNPATGEWIEYTTVAEDSNGELVRFTWRSMPGGVISEHVHPNQEERFTIVSGEATFTVDGEPRTAIAGETVVVPPGVPHSEGNRGTVEITGVVELRPALRTKEFHEALAGLVADGRTTPRGAPRNPLQLGATFWHFRHESRVTSPPIWVQNLVFPPLWAAARTFGLRPYHQRWDSSIGAGATPGPMAPDPTTSRPGHGSTHG
jgi:quercetin dioxygenase-like cupin family protein